MKLQQILLLLFAAAIQSILTNEDFVFPDEPELLENGESVARTQRHDYGHNSGIKTRHHSRPDGFGSAGYGGSHDFGHRNGHGWKSGSQHGYGVEDKMMAPPNDNSNSYGSMVSNFFSSFGKKKIPFEGSDLKEDTLAFLDNARFQIPPIGSCREPLQIPLNTLFKCQDGTNTCKLSCMPQYFFPEGRRSLNLACMSGQWIIQDVEWSEIPTCIPECQPACLNNGICTEPGLCKCPENYYGAYCQDKKVMCPTRPPVPKNSRLSCRSSKCNVECLKGYQFPDGTGITNMECKNGQWLHTKSGQMTTPDCEPICDPPCQNSGTCVAFNVCQCLKDFKGPRCEYDYKVCNITKAGFNGNFRCSYTTELAKCSLNCPENIKFDIPAANEYICKYQEGVFTPSPLPKCVYPKGYKIISSGYSSSTSFVPGGEYYGYSASRGSKSEKDGSVETTVKWRHNTRNNEMFSSSEEMFDTPGSYSLYVTQDIDGIIDKTPKPAMCATWAGVNVKTFDGLVYKSPLSYSHTLVSDNIDGTFDVIMKACPFGSGYNCPHSLKIFWQSILYTFESKNGTVKMYTPKKKLLIPIQVMGMKVEPVGQDLLISLESVGLSILWDTKQKVIVEASAGLWNRTGGICGTLDANLMNDFVSKDGKLVKTPKAFTDSWKVQSYDEGDVYTMENSQEVDFDKACDAVTQKVAEEVCMKLLLNEKLSECVKPYNMKVLLKICAQDYCNCPNKESPEACNCDTMSTLAKECAFRNVKLEHGWRNLEICPMNCKNGRVYKPCGPSMEPTCGSAIVSNKDSCNEGCFCPEGTIQHKDTCISPELCPCTLRNKEFKTGSKVQKDCNTCTCESGMWKCTDETCGSRCGAVGDPHYCTFDGKKFDFMGKCSYYLLKMDNFSVETENVACPGSISENMDYAPAQSLEMPSCTKSVTINVVAKGKEVQIKLGQGLTVVVNNKEVTKFPKVITIGNAMVLIRQASSTMITVDFDDGARVWWDGMTRVYIDAPASYRGKTKGLCGTFNSNTKDDFLTPEGDIETSVQPFADKWRTKDTCDLLSDASTTLHPCTANPQNKQKAEKYCAMIFDEIFGDCLFAVEPEPYYENCVYDVCACKEDPHKCFCPILSAYGAECARQGTQTNWRYTVKECAITCPAGQIFEECGDSCVRTCEDISRRDTCQGNCVEGCRCPHGQYLNEDNECVPEKHCSCMYDGITFKPGYKEVRPGRKFLELCTCSGGVWECDVATDGDKEKYPPAQELKLECANKQYAEFSKCVPNEPKTCKNMDNYAETFDDCVPGCVCSAGYVYDTSLQICVIPEDCSCHHGGRSYADGQKIREDCNECKCKSGNWECTKDECDSTCSVWGDSHFTTYDNQDFDFQGACYYVLSKGVAANGDGFTVSIQNVFCGTLGVTCSKSVKISLTGSTEDSISLTSDPSYLEDASKSPINKLKKLALDKPYNIYKAGIFVVVEVIPLGLQIKWDEGTRVYVKLGSQWKGKVSGLCGNYNGDSNDDMKTPSLGLETSPMLFGHSWKLLDHCPTPTEPIDACKEHPQRETWAQLKCGVLKSSVFQDCHSEVPVEKYIKRCIFDTCACDQGGDCECLCTSIAAYAYACSVKGVHIKWRTPHFCPMQCDPHCSEYDSCTQPCPVETCENFLDQGVSNRMCAKENCFEGCHIKPCDDGMIYTNDTYGECVPKAQCKPICMEKDGKVFYEGDITRSDKCQTCRCTKKKETCSGAPCVEVVTPKSSAPLVLGSTTTFRPLQTEEQPQCVAGWSKWYNQDDEPGSDGVKRNDVEPLPTYDQLENVYATCTKKFIAKVECRVAGSHETYDKVDDNCDCDLEKGLKCMGKCQDYEIRVFCQCEPGSLPLLVETTTVRNLVNGSCDVAMAEYQEFPGDCYKFLHCQPQTDGTWQYVEKTCGPTMMFNPLYNVCDHIISVQLLKPSCGGSPTETTTAEPVQCPPGKKWSDCANRCEHSCHFYRQTLLKRGLCNLDDKCKGGCVDASEAIDCPAMNKLWRDKSTCVDIDECPCISLDEEYVKPHSVHEQKVFGVCSTCQCIDNAYVCTDCTQPEIPKEIVTTTPVYDMIYSTETPLIIPTTVTPPLKCNPELLVPLINGEVPMQDSTFSASSELGSLFVAPNARLHAKPSGKSNGSWSPKINDQMQYLQIDLNQTTPIFGVVMQGSPIFDQYVTLFKILHSYDGVAFHYLVDQTDSPQLFNGPIDSRTPVESLFKIPIEAKVVRIYPLKWHGSIAMRVELLGCGKEKLTTSTERITTTTAVPTTTKAARFEIEPICTDKLGVESEQMSGQQLHASSMWPSPVKARKPKLTDLLKLSSPVGWRPALNSPNEYVKFDFLESRNITGVITKGGPSGWVSGYKIMYSKNGFTWNTVLVPDGVPRVFIGNHDFDTPQTNYFKYPIHAQYLKIVPLKWEHDINMRVEPVGCFLPYPVVKENIEMVERPPPVPVTHCPICADIPVSNEVSLNDVCKCTQPLYWNGTSCTERHMCPCVENHISYPIGSKFENKECQECVCVLGGTVQCKPKKCPACPAGERPVTTDTCFCKCETCPEMQKLCPSSGDCIPEHMWCNGIKDCEDDEPPECKIVFVPDDIEPTRTTSTTIIKSCPAPECPPGMKMKITDKAATRTMSQIFKSSKTKQVTTTRNGSNYVRTKVITKVEEFMPTAELEEGFDEIEECAEFVCAPEPRGTVVRNETFSCTLPKCPDDYEVEVDNSINKPGQCIKYTCVLRPQKDHVCQINGKSFTTFDGTEFKYDTCSHILARDLVDPSWAVSLHQNCSKEPKICKKELVVKDKEADAILTILPDLSLSFNGFVYNVRQLQRSPVAKSAFIISKPGNTILIVSKLHGFWVSYDDASDIKVGISAKFKKTVDGLCGYYNNNPDDDKRMPDGTVTDNTKIFGDSWYDKEVPKEECYPQVCPRNMQMKALHLCNSIKHPSFLACGKAVNYKQFTSKCIETTCDCLQANGGDLKACKCSILQGFVKQCLAAKPNVKLDTWRTMHDCEIACPSPLVHKDCFKRRCEPSCDNANSDDCPVLADACFSGCYCPEGTVRKGETCVPVTECKDCSCDSFGKSKFFTYDRQNFTFNGNCTYLLSRDIVLPGVHTFQVYVSMDACEKDEHSSCAKTLHILHGQHIIHIERIRNKSLKVLADGMEVKKLPLKSGWIEIKEMGGKELNLLIPDSQVEVTSSFDDMAFSIRVPSIKYGSKMEGLCGDCNGNPDDDLKLNPKKKSGKKNGDSAPSLKDVVTSWQSDEPKLGLPQDECLSKDVSTDACIPLPPDQDPCMKFFDEKKFGKCHLLVDPIAYVSACQQDMCKPGSNQKGACDSLAAYAKECTGHGICLDWREANLCPYECPAHLKYKSCGCTKTCESIKESSVFDVINMKTNTVVKPAIPDSECDSERSEGCYCAEGRVLHDKKCISEEQCTQCDDKDHYPGDVWTKGKCTECSCNKEGKTECIKQDCSVQESICGEGFTPSKVTNELDCCPKYICVPEPKVPIKITCPDAPLPQCGPGQFKKQKIGTDGCPQFICECKPLSECEPLPTKTPLKSGEKLVIDKSGCCPTQKVICDKSTCPTIPAKCDNKLHELTKIEKPEECCSTYKCAPPKDTCIVKENGKEVLKRLNEKWIDPNKPCIEKLCTYGPENTMQVSEVHETCDLFCPKGYEYQKKDSAQCCGKCVQTKCVFEDKLYGPSDKWQSPDNCTNYVCLATDGPLVISSLEETCPDVSLCPEELKYKEGCCTMCKPVPAAQKNCLPASMAEQETVGLVQVLNPGHGLCMNKEPIRGFTECQGSCESGSKYNRLSYGQSKICHCCSIREYSTIKVPLICSDSSVVTKEIQVPADCGCDPCNDSNSESNEAMLDIRSTGNKKRTQSGIKG